MPSIAQAHYATMGVAQCDTAADGLTAMDLVTATDDASAYNMIICDISMPHMDGVQLIAALAEIGFKGWIAIISSQQPSVCNTALSIAESYGMKLAGLGRKPVTRQMLEGFLLNMELGSNKVPSLNNTMKPMSEADIRIAIEEGRVVPFYQPIVDLESGEVIAAEALARITGPDGRIIPPFAFIETAEKSGLLEALTRAMFTTLLEDIAEINRYRANFNMAINWDPKLLEQKALPDELQEICRSKGISPTQLTLEITETTAFEASSLILEVLVRLRLKGFGVAVDDYGTGYSNLDRLKRMPFSKLKIDQSFVRRSVDDSFSIASVETAVRLAQELDIPTIAEGVEEATHWSLMKASGATQAQGYLVSRPVPFNQFLKWAINCDWHFAPVAEAAFDEGGKKLTA
jgi:EAL domain-containing protein (putative c-di-GMP-specific phosphodiesterase class I)